VTLEDARFFVHLLPKLSGIALVTKIVARENWEELRIEAIALRGDGQVVSRSTHIAAVRIAKSVVPRAMVLSEVRSLHIELVDAILSSPSLA
jgi:hypothetical protein